ncbi:fumarylacetoacetate hydrolase family protein [Luedemannella helvata]|uniref:Fumarylacetoacetate hydrolase family protein n=1 Tax=Luedemannella helvata TaxID=349315 RepID=A0ABP4VWX6_9ACTN
MRLGTIRHDGRTVAVRDEGEAVVLLDAPDVGTLLATDDWAERAATHDGPRLPAAGLTFDAPVPQPGAVFCVGLNYRTHIEESGEQVPAYPTLFGKLARTLIGPHDDIQLPAGEDRLVDWEAELVVVVGRAVRHADPATAAAAIAGFTVGNDISVRDYQRRTSQWLQGKCFEATTPVGPWLRTVDETGPAPDLAISCAVDGDVKQASRTSDLLFGPAELVGYLSRIVTLRPGDLIFTGTPGGVGQSRTPAEFLHAGSIVETTIEGIGSLRNTCVPAA